MFNGVSELMLTTQRLPVFYKERDSLLYPAWAFALPIWVLRVPISFGESLIWISLTYYTIGFAPSVDRYFKQFLAFVCINQMAQGLFRSIAAVARSVVIAPVIGMFTLLVVFVLDDIQPWLIWGYYISPMMYGQNAIVINEFLHERWSDPNPDPRILEATIGKAILKVRGMFVENKWYWISIGALIGFTMIYNICFVIALTYLDPLEDSKSIILDDNQNKRSSKTSEFNSSSIEITTITSCTPMEGPDEESRKKGMVLPFQPLSLAFKNVNYYVDMPAEMKSQGVEEERLQLLHNVSGAFRPGVLTALVGNQRTFARISGYCEQNDIHSPRITVYESLLHSAWMRLSKNVNKQDRMVVLFEQRKRLTIAVELVANPSIIFMDEPTSGLDARAAAIVMRTVRNTVDTGRTVVCTIHQPSIDIFESFDEVSSHIQEGTNPATWMLDVSSSAVESHLDVDFAEIYSHSELYKRNQELIEELSTPSPGSNDLYFPTQYAQDFLTQCRACFMKLHRSYWQNPSYNVTRFFLTIIFDVFNLLGATYSAVMFLGGSTCSAVMPIVSIERTILYRERAAGMYSEMAFAIAQVSIEATYVAIQTFVYCVILFLMIGYPWHLANFLWYYFFICMSFIYFALYGMMLVALTPGYQIAAITMSFFLTTWNIFSGFIILRTLGNIESLVEVPGQGSMSVKQFLKQSFGFDYDFLVAVAAAHIGFVFLFLFVFAYGIRFLNFQRR
ncbi:unnamed protein product [Linum tenue]|uniref:ABC transporter domain-containing protein n=1 Tax=Linum tenue TaxID=586396 RepID=A0AAV0JNC9_9ROSI|nr:unnamed protein product [Linum tenue]